MASTLSPSAVHRIISLVLYAPIEENDTKNPYYSVSHVLQRVNSKWEAIYRLYMGIRPTPPLDYLDSMELALVLKGEVDDDDVRAIFAHGKPLEFWGCPRLLVSKIVEAFTAMQKEPEYLDVTITALSRLGATKPSEAWPQVYRSHLPCHACSTVEAVEERSITQESSRWLSSSAEAVNFAVEKFHVSSRSFRKRLTLGLHYQLTRGTAEIERFSDIHKMTIRLTDETCSAQGRLSGYASRSSATMLLLPDFASEVYGFLERAHVGSSLLANRGLHERLCQLKNSLPVHRLKCAFDKEMSAPGYVSGIIGAYWMEIRHRQRDLSYIDARRLKLPSDAGAEDDCALIRHYLSNSHVAHLQPASFPFTIKMLASLAGRNFSVGRVELYATTKRLSDYRSMDAVFGGLRMGELDLSCDEHHFEELVKTSNFFRMSTIQGLRKLKLTLSEPWMLEEESRGQAMSKSPLWVSGICLLRNCDYYQVNYETDRHMRSFERKMVRICEKFERGEITDTVQHFQFNTLDEVTYAFNRNNLVASGMKVDGESEWDPVKYFEWDVYRFRNASTHEYLTACIGRNSPRHRSRSILHIVKGEVFPGAYFAIY